MKTLITCLLCLLSMGSLMAQTSLYGQVTDQEAGEPILFGSVVLYQNGVLVTGTETDLDGNYHFNNIDPGTYDVEAAYVGYATKKISAVKVLAGKANKLDIILDAGSVTLDECSRYRIQSSFDRTRQYNFRVNYYYAALQIKKKC